MLSVPARAVSLVAPAEFPPPEYFASLPFPMLAAPGSSIFKLPGLPRSTLLASPVTFEDLDFERLEPASSQEHDLSFVVSREGELRGLAIHIELYMTSSANATPAAAVGISADAVGASRLADVADAAAADAAAGDAAARDVAGGYGGGGGDRQEEASEQSVPTGRRRADVSSAREGSHWPNVFLMLPEYTPVRAGSHIRVRTQAHLGSDHPRYTFEVWLTEPVERQSTEANQGEAAGSAAGNAEPISEPRLLGSLSYPE